MTNPKRPKVPFNPGDLVTGIDRSYTRSIYKFLESTDNPDIGLFEFVSLSRDVIERWKDGGANIEQYRFLREYAEFRLANGNEIVKSNRARGLYLLRRLLRKLGLAAHF